MICEWASMFKDFIWAKLSGGEFVTQGRGVDIFRREPYLLSREEGVECWLSRFECLFYESFLDMEGSFGFLANIL